MLFAKEVFVISTLRRKVFSVAPVKHFFLEGSNNSGSVVSGNDGFEEIKGHSLSTSRIDFLKVFYHELFSRYLTSVKKYSMG